jgi:hypothetical protein
MPAACRRRDRVLHGFGGADVGVTLEIEAAISVGTPDHVGRLENGRTLSFTSKVFETE